MVINITPKRYCIKLKHNFYEDLKRAEKDLCIDNNLFILLGSFNTNFIFCYTLCVYILTYRNSFKKRPFICCRFWPSFKRNGLITFLA